MDTFPAIEMNDLLHMSDTTMEEGDNTLTMSDGTATMPDSTVTMPDSTVTMPDSTVTMPDSSVSMPDSSVTMPSNTATLSDSTLSLQDVTATLSDSTLSLQDVTATLPGSTTTLPDSTAILSDNTMTDLSVICVDSDGDTEEHAVVISDTEEDVIFVVKIEGRRSRITSNHNMPEASEIVDLSDQSFNDEDPLDLSLGSTRLNSADSDTMTLANTDGTTVPMGSEFSSLLHVKGEDSCSERQSRIACFVDAADINNSPSKSTCDRTDLALLDLTLSPKIETHPKSLLPELSVITPPSNRYQTFESAISSLNKTFIKNNKQDMANDAKSTFSQSSSLSGHDSDLTDTDVSSSNDSDSDLPSLNSPISSICASDLLDSDDNLPTPHASPVAVSPLLSPGQSTASTSTTPVSPWSTATPMFDSLLQFPTFQDRTSESSSNKTIKPLPIRPTMLNAVSNRTNHAITDLCNNRSTSGNCKRDNNPHPYMVPLKKRKTNLFTMDDEDDQLTVGKVHRPATIVESHGECSQCEKMVAERLLLRCTCSRHCCNQCLEKQVTTLLTKRQKGLPKCGSDVCELDLDLDKLHGFLPTMVMSILKKKIEEEAISDIMEFLNPVKGEAPRKDIEKVMDLPEYWDPMVEYQDYKLVSLNPEHSESIHVSAMFHKTMRGPRAQIISIKRIQNPTLWRFFSMKRHQMKSDLGYISTIHPIERQLFHGTKNDHTESICRDNFDWRMCGVHGTVYGMGTYFARDSTYSHRYTDQPNGCPHPNRSSLYTAANHLLSLPHLPQSITSRLAFVSSMRGGAGPVPSPTSSSPWNLPSCLFNPIPSGPPNTIAPFSSGPPNTTAPPPQSSNPSQVLMSAADPMLGQASEGTSAPKAPHHHVMFLARVLTGQYTPGKSNYRKPPSIEHHSTKYYDSCVNSITNPSIFVVFDKSQCYPEYVLDYINEPISGYI